MNLLEIDYTYFADCFKLVPCSYVGIMRVEHNGLKKSVNLGKVLRRLEKQSQEKLNPRMRAGADDLMLNPVGKPGSQERIEAMRLAVERGEGIFETPS